MQSTMESACLVIETALRVIKMQTGNIYRETEISIEIHLFV